MVNKKGIELSLSTIIIFIIALFVIIFALIFFTKFGNPIINAFKDRADVAIDIVNQTR